MRDCIGTARERDASGRGVGRHCERFVSAGIDPSRPLAAQGDAFWWSAAGFAGLSEPYAGFRRLIRGHDPASGGLQLEGMTVTLDSGCGRGGRLACGLFDPDGTLAEIVEA